MITLIDKWRILRAIKHGADMYCHPDDLEACKDMFSDLCNVYSSPYIERTQMVALKPPPIPDFKKMYMCDFTRTLIMDVVEDDIIQRGYRLTGEASRRFVECGFTHLRCDGVTTVARVVDGVVYIGDEVVL